MLSSLQIPELGSDMPRSLALVLVGGHPPQYLASCVTSSSLTDMLTPPCSKCSLVPTLWLCRSAQEASFCLLVSNPKT